MSVRSEKWKEVESHLTWLEEFIPRHRPPGFHVTARLKNWQISEKKPAGSACSRMTEDDKLGYHLLKFNKLIFNKLDRAALCIRWNQLEEATKTLDWVTSKLPNLNGDHKRLRPAVKYAIETMRWSLQVLNSNVEDELSSGEGMSSTNFTHEEDIARLKEKLNQLMSDRKSRAVVNYMKIHLDMSLKFSSPQKITEQLKEVIALDPDYFLWHRYLFKFLKESRKYKEKKRHTYISPCEDERAAIISAYNLRPSVLKNMFSMGLMTKECVLSESILAPPSDDNGGTDVTCSDEDIAEFEKGLKYLSDAMELAMNLGSQWWVFKIQREQASILLHLKSQDAEIIERGNEMPVREHFGKIPHNELVLRKIAQYYKSETSEAQKLLSGYANSAKTCFKLALNKYPDDIILLGGYINFLKSYPYAHPSDYYDLLDIMDKTLEVVQDRREDVEAYVQILRGCLIWIYNPDNLGRDEKHATACEIWINVMKKFPTENNNLFEILRKPPFVLIGAWAKIIQGKINHLDLLVELNKIRRRLEEDKEKRDEKTLQSIFNLWVMGEMDLPDSPPKPTERDAMEKNFPKGRMEVPWSGNIYGDSTNNGNPYRSNGPGNQSKGKPRPRAKADSDGNWRSGK